MSPPSLPATINDSKPVKPPGGSAAVSHITQRILSEFDVTQALSW